MSISAVSSLPPELIHDIYKLLLFPFRLSFAIILIDVGEPPIGEMTECVKEAREGKIATALAALYCFSLLQDFNILYYQLQQRFSDRLLPAKEIYRIQSLLDKFKGFSGLAESEYAFVKSFLPVDCPLPVEILMSSLRVNNDALVCSWFEQHEPDSITIKQQEAILDKTVAHPFDTRSTTLPLFRNSTLVVRLLLEHHYIFTNPLLPDIYSRCLAGDKQQEIRMVINNLNRIRKIITSFGDLKLLEKFFHYLGTYQVTVPDPMKGEIFDEIVRFSKDPFTVIAYLSQTAGLELVLRGRLESLGSLNPRALDFIVHKYGKEQNSLSEEDKCLLLKQVAFLSDEGKTFRYLIEQKDFRFNDDVLSNFLTTMVASDCENQIRWVIDFCQENGYELTSAEYKKALSKIHKLANFLPILTLLVEHFPGITVLSIASAIGNIVATRVNWDSVAQALLFYNEKLSSLEVETVAKEKLRDAMFKPVSCMAGSPFQAFQYLLRQVPDKREDTQNSQSPLSKAMKGYIGSTIGKMVLSDDSEENFKQLWIDIQAKGWSIISCVQAKAFEVIFAAPNLTALNLEKLNFLFDIKYFSWDGNRPSVMFEKLFIAHHIQPQDFDWFFECLKKGDYQIKQHQGEPLKTLISSMLTNHCPIRTLQHCVSKGYIIIGANTAEAYGAFLSNSLSGLRCHSLEEFEWALQQLKEGAVTINAACKQAFIMNILVSKERDADRKEKLKRLHCAFPFTEQDRLSLVEQAHACYQPIAVEWMLRNILALSNNDIAAQVLLVLTKMVELVDIAGLTDLFRPGSSFFSDNSQNLTALSVNTEIQADLAKTIKDKKGISAPTQAYLLKILGGDIISSAGIGFFSRPPKAASTENTPATLTP